MACAAICPHDAIDITRNKLGFSEPRVISDRCIDCRLCQKICPSISLPVTSSENKVYAASANDVNLLNHSSSGGIATLIARHFIENGGIVYGCSGKDIENIKYLRIDNVELSSDIQGSKYIQGCILPFYKKIRADLSSGRKVLFIGIPCQVSGVRKFLMKRYDNFYSIDIICHGAASSKMLNENIEYYKKKINSKLITDVMFRVKEKDSNGLTRIQYGFYFNAKGKHWSYPGFSDPFMLAYINNLSFRDSCYDCKYTNLKRVSDLTLGDFWGLGIDAGLGDRLGVSLCITHSSKGENMLHSLKQDATIIRRDLNEAVKDNPQLTTPSKPGKQIKRFREIFIKKGFVIGVQRSCWKVLLKYRIYHVVASLGLIGLFKYLKSICRT